MSEKVGSFTERIPLPDPDTGELVRKYGVEETEIFDEAIKTGDTTKYSTIKKEKESLENTKKELYGEAMATGNFDQVGYNTAYNLGINQAVVKKTKSIASDIKMDLFASDSEIVNYYTNYDANQAKIDQEVESGYAAAYKREQTIDKSVQSLEDTYESIRIQQDAKENQEKQEALSAITNVFSKFANLGDLDVGTTTTEADDGFSID